jgi:hypothetical protein
LTRTTEPDKTSPVRNAGGQRCSQKSQSSSLNKIIIYYHIQRRDKDQDDGRGVHDTSKKVSTASNMGKAVTYLELGGTSSHFQTRYSQGHQSSGRVRMQNLFTLCGSSCDQGSQNVRNSRRSTTLSPNFRTCYACTFK